MQKWHGERKKYYYYYYCVAHRRAGGEALGTRKRQRTRIVSRWDNRREINLHCERASKRARAREAKAMLK